MRTSAPALLTPSQVADQLGVPVRSLYAWRSTGRPSPRAIKVGKHLRFSQESVDEFIREQTEPVPA